MVNKCAKKKQKDDTPWTPGDPKFYFVLIDGILYRRPLPEDFRIVTTVTTKTIEEIK